MGTHAERDTVVVVAHEIWGVGPHVMGVARDLRARTGHDVVTPMYLPEPVRDGAGEHEAYASFHRLLGVTGMADLLIRDAERLRESYRAVHCVGYSVGATAAWLACGRGVLDRTVCVYGSRIRDHLDVEPRGRTLVVVPAAEVSFDPHEIVGPLRGRNGVEVDLVEGTAHGFTDRRHPAFDPRAAAATARRIAAFLTDRAD